MFLRFYKKIGTVRSLVVAVGSVLNLTKSRIEHVQSHAVALFSSCDRHKSLIAVVLRLVDLDDAATHLADLVDLLPALSYDGAHHVVGNVDLLRDRATRHTSLDRLALSMGLGSRVATHMWLNMRSSSVGRGRLTAILNRDRRVGVRTGVRIVLGVRGRRQLWLGASIVLALVVVISTSITAWRVLRAVRHNLHTARNRSGRSTASGRVRGGSRAAKTVIELLEKSAANVVSGDVDSVSDSHNNQRALTRHGQACIRCIQSCSRCVLNLSDSSAALTNDGSD